MTTAKLHINLGQGLIEAEGEEDFVLRIYEDFKARLSEIPEPQDDEDTSGITDAASVHKRGAKVRRKIAQKVSGDGRASSGGGITSYEPKRDPDLDLSGLADYVGQYDLKGNPERYLVYAHFLKDMLQIAPCSIDHLFSCFLEMKDDLPTRMGQNLVDVRARNGFLKFTTPRDITITTTGTNHFNKKLTKKGAE